MPTPDIKHSALIKIIILSRYINAKVTMTTRDIKHTALIKTIVLSRYRNPR